MNKTLILVFPLLLIPSAVTVESTTAYKVWERQRGAKVSVVVTKYNAVKEQTDDTPTITASNKKIKKGMIALSRDLEEELGLKFGDKIHLTGMGTFIFEDRMNKKWTRRVDIYEKSIEEAKKFGIKKTELIVE